MSISRSLRCIRQDPLMKIGGFTTDAGRAARIVEQHAKEIDRAFANGMSNVKKNIISDILPAILTNAGQTKIVVGSDNNLIARAGSLLYAVEREHNGPCLIPEQAGDVLAWAGQVT